MNAEGLARFIFWNLKVNDGWVAPVGFDIDDNDAMTDVTVDVQNVDLVDLAARIIREVDIVHREGEHGPSCTCQQLLGRGKTGFSYRESAGEGVAVDGQVTQGEGQEEVRQEA